MQYVSRLIVAALLALTGTTASCADSSPRDTDVSTVRQDDAVAAKAPATSPARHAAFAAIADQEKLHNAYIVSDKVVSGAQPDGDASFQVLQSLGVKTIISVDGAAPDVEKAWRFGMRYVHIPIGYDGVERAQGEAIAKAIDELPGRVYVHCHHGRHRSAAAVAVACVYNGQIQPEQAELVLQTFGTGANYTGLWQAARQARPMDTRALRAKQVVYVERAKIDDFAESMVHIDRHWDHVKSIQKAGWKAPADHPDLDPRHEVLMVRERLHEAGRLTNLDTKGGSFRELLFEGEESLKTLVEVLQRAPIDATTADRAFAAVANNCSACHQSFRD